MEITMSGFDTTRNDVLGVLLQCRQGSPIAVRERSVAPVYAPMTGAVRPQPVQTADLTDHSTVEGDVKGGVRVRTWSPPD